MKRIIIKAAALLMCAVFAGSMSGCVGKIIAEDRIKLELPDIDPEDGLEKEMDITLYFRLVNEAYLVGVKGTVAVREGERTEAAVIRGLIEGDGAASGLTATMHPDTTVKELSFENGILYVTLSGEFLNDDAVKAINQDDFLKEKDYNSAVKAATREMYLGRRLGVLSIVNTVAGNGEDVKVMLFVEDNGRTRSLEPQELGLDETHTEFSQPMSFDESVIATGEIVAGCLLQDIMDGDYAAAYRLTGESRETAKPSFAQFEAEIRALGTVVSYEITGSGSDDNGDYVLANVRIESHDGIVKKVTNAVLYLSEEGNISKVGYGSLKKLMES